MFKDWKFDNFSFEKSYIGAFETYIFTDEDENWFEIIPDNRSNGYIVEYVYDAFTVCVEYYSETEIGDVFMYNEIKKTLDKFWGKL